MANQDEQFKGIKITTAKYCIPTDQGTGNSDTALCDVCFAMPDNKCYAREMASRTDDINPKGDFVECSGNEAVECCICGAM